MITVPVLEYAITVVAAVVLLNGSGGGWRFYVGMPLLGLVCLALAIHGTRMAVARGGLIVVSSVSATTNADRAGDLEPGTTADVRQRTKVYRIGWAKLLARVFDTDVKACPHCGGERTVRAWVTKRASIERLLDHWDLSADLPISEPARAPPQTELFSSG